MKLMEKFRGQARPAPQQLQDQKASLDAQLEALRRRRAEIAELLPAARARKEGLAVQGAVATLEGAPEGKASRHADAIAEVDRLELAVKIADQQTVTLEAQQTRAMRRVVVALALEQLDRLTEIADQVDAAWGPMREQLGELVLAADDVAAILDRLTGPGHQHGITRGRLGRVLLWRIGDLIDLRADAHERVSMREVLSYPQTRVHLERELAEGEEEQS